MFTPPNEQDKPVSDNQTPEAKTAAEQPAAPGFGVDLATVQEGLGWLFSKLERESTRIFSSHPRLEVQKIRLFEAIVEQQKLGIQQELGITLNVWTHQADLEQYAQNQGYLGDASHMSRIEGELRSNVLQGPKLVFSAPVELPIVPAVEIKREAEGLQAGLLVEEAKPAVLDHEKSQKILALILKYEEAEQLKIREQAGAENANLSPIQHPYSQLKKNVSNFLLKTPQQQIGNLSRP